MNMYVSNLGFGVKDEDLKALFASYGEVSSAKVIIDKITNQSRGFGFVEMPNDEIARQCISELNGTEHDGRSIKVTEARAKEDRGSNGSSRRW
jgi:RNA recognition motif-containing protein